jgi:hypothetical protein
VIGSCNFVILFLLSISTAFQLFSLVQSFDI